jgi:hypothetical protein
MALVDKFYLDALAEFSDKLKGRKKELRAAAEKVESFLKRTFPEQQPTLLLSEERFDTAMQSYFFDIHRYKHFSGMLSKQPPALINHQKVFAFTVKWIAKEKPFTLIRKSVERTPACAEYIRFASNINEVILLVWLRGSFKKLVKRDLILTPEEERKFLYSVRFREVSTGFIELFLSTKFPPPESPDARKLHALL